MGYQIRKSYPGSDAHVTSRCINYKKTKFLKKQTIKQMFISVVNEAEKKYHFKLVNYCIMNNHFHLIIHIPKEGDNLGLIMQYIKSVFAKKFNKAAKRTGPFWNERYKEKIIQLQNNPEEYFYYLLWYIFYNPVKAGLVKKPNEYKYSGINHYLEENYKSMIKIYHHQYFIDLGKSHTERIENLKKYENQYLLINKL